MRWIAPASDCAELVSSFFVAEAHAGELHDVLPAYSAQVAVFVRGSAKFHHRDAESGASSDITIIAPMTRAARISASGPLLVVGGSLTALGWALLGDWPVKDVRDCLVNAADCIGKANLDALGQAISRAREDQSTVDTIAAELERMMRAVNSDPDRAISPDHRQAIGAIEAWLASGFNPSLDELYGSISGSERHVQRLCNRYYGAPPAQLLKRRRAIHAAMLLSRDDVPEQYREEVLAAYYDQPHLINDMKRFMGRTPNQLADGALSGLSLDPHGHGRTGAILAELRDTNDRREPD